MRHLVLAALISAPAAATAQSTVDLAWQGRLLDATGVPVNATQDLTVSLWDAASAGTSVYSATYPSQPVSDGYLSVLLQGIPDTAFVDANHAPRFLWVQVAIAGAVLGARTPMNTVPYAANLVGGTAKLSGALFLGTAPDSVCGGGNGTGALVYDPIAGMPRFCDGTQWITLGRTTVTLSGAARRWSDGSVAASCDAYRNPSGGFNYEGNVGDGYYTVDPDGAGGNAAANVYCDMTTNGGGWTAVLQCLPSDNCSAAGTALYANPWNTTDYGTSGDAASYLLGQTLSPVIAAAPQFMTEVRRTATGETGFWIFPMHMGFFNAGAGISETGDVTATVIDSDGTTTSRAMRTCWSNNNATYTVRSYRGANGMPFLGLTNANPNTGANTDCDFGAWQSQALVRVGRTGATAQSTTLGTTYHTAWSGSAYAHRVFVR